MNRDANRRRQALNRFMQKHDLTRGALARLADIPPNIIYNFLSGKSNYLAQPTLERIAQKLGVSIADIVGEETFLPAVRKAAPVFQEADSAEEYVASPSSSAVSSLTTLKVVGAVTGVGVWGQSIFLDPDRDEFVSFDLPGYYAGKAFAVKLLGNAMDEIFPSGTILGCVAMNDYLQRIMPGDIVVMVSRNSLGLFETAVRQYVVEDKKHYLISRSRDPRYRDKAELLSPLSDPAALGHQDFYIHAVVMYYAANLPASRR